MPSKKTNSKPKTFGKNFEVGAQVFIGAGFRLQTHAGGPLESALDEGAIRAISDGRSEDEATRQLGSLKLK